MKRSVDYLSNSSDKPFLGGSGGRNDSWICLAYPERGWTSPECFFLYFQQFHQPTYAKILECVTVCVICLLSYPANILLVVNFIKRGVYESFLLLVIASALCDMIQTTIGFMIAVTRVTENWIFGQIGCAGWVSGCLIIMTMSVWIKVVISFERQTCVRSARRTSVHMIASVLMTIFAVDTLIWSYPYFYLKIAHTMSLNLTVKGANQTDEVVESVEVCTLFTYKIANGGLAKSIFGLCVLFWIPLLVMTINYWKIWNHMVRSTARCSKHRSSSASLLSDIVALNNDSEYKAKMDRRRERDVYFIRLMIKSLVIFIVTNAPVQAILFYVPFDSLSTRLRSSCFVTSLCVYYLNAVINPILYIRFVNTPQLTAVFQPVLRRPKPAEANIAEETKF